MINSKRLNKIIQNELSKKVEDNLSQVIRSFTPSQKELIRIDLERIKNETRTKRSIL